MRTVTLSIFLFLLVFISSCKEDEIGKSEVNSCEMQMGVDYIANPKSARFQSLIDEYVAKGIPGVILLIKDEQGFYIGSSGMADIRAGIEMQTCHVSKICSITKFMIGVSIMRMQERGELSIDDPISKYLSADILDKIENGNEPLTIRNLMNHTSGIYDVIDDQGFYLQVLNNPSKHWTQEDLLEFVYNKPALFPFSPADTAGYSNTNYTLLTMIMEKASGKSQSEILHEIVIDPLGLSNTYYFWHDKLPEGKIAQGYYDLYNNGNLENLTNWNTGSGNGYGGVYSTVWDMYLFAKALFVDKSLLSQASLDQMLVFHHTIESRKQLGVSCYKDFIDVGNPELDFAWGHRGRDLSYSADLFYFPHHHAIMSLIVNYGTDGDSPLRPVFKEMRDKIALLIDEPY
ncbi:MAG: serine hydrolase [Bacteroidales bacterium]|nr:serine hydrolase [Bacteroidales bacterium]